jgi:putative tryptophan/tyrosine transport system substrate-binding protein
MNRRDLLSLLGGATMLPVAARAQLTVTPVIGMLVRFLPETAAPYLAAFRKGLGETGFDEGRNVAIDARYAQTTERLAELAADLVLRRVAAIATLGGPAPVLAAKAASTTIPIVFETGADPIQTGLVASLNKPGGNATGLSFLAVETQPKLLGFLHELLPGAKQFAMLVNFEINDARTSAMRSAAATIGAQIEFFQASNIREIDAAFSNLVQKHADALLVNAAPFFIDRAAQIVTLAVHYAVPTIHFQRQFAAIGGLMSYGPNYLDQVRQVGVYVGRVLKGEKPADLPVMQPTKSELVINLSTARVLGLDIPPILLALADEVIE